MKKVNRSGRRNTEPGGRSRGRPRDPELDARILGTTLKHLAADSFAGMTIDAVARDAGVSKASIYRRWRDKNDLVTAAIASFPAPSAEQLAGNTKQRLEEILSTTRARMIDGPGMMIQSQILAESRRNPELLKLHRERTIEPRTAIIRRVIEEGIDRGEVREDVDVEIVCDLINGSWRARWTLDEDFPKDWSARVVATIWPMLERHQH